MLDVATPLNFRVKKVPIAAILDGGIHVSVDDKAALLREDNNKPISIVGSAF